MKEIEIEIDATNIGPHRELKAKLSVARLELGLFANNGSGKTFLSRVLRLAGKSNTGADDANRLLTLGQSQANFTLKIISLGNTRKLSINIKRGDLPVVLNDTNLIFHVFNQDYVKENLVESGYSPNGTIEGFILGKETIDLSKEKDNLEKIKSDRLQKVEKLKDAVDDVRRIIEGLGIRRNTTEFIAINFENLVNFPEKYEEADSFQTLRDRLAKLKAFPDNLPDLTKENTIHPSSLSNEISAFLDTELTRSSAGETFKLRIKSKQEFVEKGLALKGNDTHCPFCEQEFNKSALNLIDQYLQYLNDEEAKQIKKANQYLYELSQLNESLKIAYLQSLKGHEQFNNLKTYLPSLENEELSLTGDPSVLTKNFNAIVAVIESKKSNIGAIDGGNVKRDFDSISAWINNLNDSFIANEKIFKVFNQKKNNLQNERLELNKRLCKAAYVETVTNQRQLIESIKNLGVEIANLENEIAAKAETQRVSKKAKIATTFQDFLGKFFGRKYTFDSTSFALKFDDYSLADNASDVLSEGEKSVVAFCYFLAETHKIVNNKSDYKRLFFVIDDPISSLDFHFVYNVANTIRSLRFLFLESQIHFFILTHNLEFMSILTRNNIIEDKFILSGGSIHELGRNLIMPYEEHIRDIYSVFLGKSRPSHTTANSIRHILETLNRFSYPNLSLANYCSKIKDFQQNAFLFSLIHDSSHGIVRTQIPYTEEMIKTGCSVVISHLSEFHSGQLEVLKT